MNDTVKLLRDVFIIVWKALLQLILIVTTIAVIPNKNLISIWLSMIVWILVFKVAQKEVDPKDWLMVFAFTIGFTFLMYFLGFIKGFLGLMLFYAVITAIQIYKNWKLLDAVTLWGAKKVKGIEVGSFDLQSVIKEDEKDVNEINRRISKEFSDGGREERNAKESVITNEGDKVVQDFVQKLPVKNKSSRTRRRKNERKNALSVLSPKVRKDNERTIKITGDIK